MKTGAQKWLFTVPGSRKIYILFLVVLQSLHGASGVLYALILRGIVDAAVNQNAPGFWNGVLRILLLVTGQIILRALIRRLNELSKSELENCFKQRLFRTILTRDYTAVSAVHSGEWMNRLTNDTVVAANGCVEIVPEVTGMVVKLVSALFMLTALDRRFARIFIPGGILLLLFTWGFRKVLKNLHKSVQEADGSLRIFLQERLGSLLIVRSFAAEELTAAQAETKMTEHQRARMKRNAFSNLCNIGFGAAMNAMYLFGVIYCGYGILTRQITFGTLTAVTQLISQIQVPVANITGYLPRYYAVLASAERLMEAEALPGDISGGEAIPGDLRGAETLPGDLSGAEARGDGSGGRGSKGGGDGRAAGLMTAEEIRELYRDHLEAIGMKNICFRYDAPPEKGKGMRGPEGSPWVLEDVSLEIQKGEFVAIMGRSGCGKSTLLKLLMCICTPESGKRYYITEDGEEKTLDARMRRLFAYVPQGNQLLSGTIREVLTFSGSIPADDLTIRESLRISCAEEFINDLEDQLDSVLGERGSGLSEGQMQRLAIARAICSGAPVLLLDEATSALDESTEQKLLSNLRAMRDRTVVIVTHRRSTIRFCDEVIMLDVKNEKGEAPFEGQESAGEMSCEAGK